MKRPKGFNRFVNLAESYIGDPHKRSSLLAAVKDYAKNKTHLIQHFKADLLTLVHLLRDWGKGSYPNVTPKTILLVVAALLYFLSPVDTIPDFLGAIGFTDDAAVVLFVLNAVKNEISLYRDWRSKQ
jgi:uncharacterized membrane protein YkvA (DUF1232 family)